MNEEKKKSGWPSVSFCISSNLNYHEDDVYDEREDHDEPRIYLRGDRD